MAKIYLIGFMGSGKTTVGRRLSTASGWPMVDMDKYIEDTVGQSIAEIFESGGEARFRELEREALLKISAEPQNIIVSTGGGMPCMGDNMDIMIASGTVIYIKMPPKALVSRLIKAKEDRPLIRGKSEAELLEYIEKMLALREPYYTRASVITDGISVNVQRLMKYINKQ